MPIGTFLDSFPSLLFVAAHVAFLGAGIWAWRKLSGRAAAPALWLYAASQVVFLTFFGGVITMKMAVLIEQTLVVVMVLWLGRQGAGRARSSNDAFVSALPNN